jgi:polyribonucleotide nucleotidyltransferase
MKSLAGGKRVNNPEDVVSVGQKIQVEITEVDNRGKISLSPVVEESDGSSAGATEAGAEPVAAGSE